MADKYIVIWEFEVRPTARAEFETIYGTDGDWAQLFRCSAQFRGTKLIHDIARPERYLTLDAWTSREALRDFKERYAAEYAALDRQCEALTHRESLIGEFTVVSQE
jgi:hypothetical protein